MMTEPIGNNTFKYVGPIQPDRNSDGICKFMPQSDYIDAGCVSLNRYGGGPFCRFRIPSDMHVDGVYAITADDDIMYVGECINLSKRFNMGYGQISPKNCYKGGQETNCRINNLVLQCAEGGHQLGLWFVSTPHRIRIEAELIKKCRPPWNR